jgi:hypothetical protein
MDSLDLHPAQAARLREGVRSSLAYIGRVRRRMELLGFPPGDALYQSVRRAHEALQELHIRSHYCACTSGVGRPRE